MANQASVQQVRYDAVQPTVLDNITALANAAFTGYRQQKIKAADDKMKMLQSILPALAQQNRLNPAHMGDPGAFDFGGAPWTVGPAQTDYGNEKDRLQSQRIQWELDNPDEAAYQKAFQGALTDSMGPLGSTEDVLKTKLGYQAAKTGQGPEEVTPGRKGGLFGFGSTPDAVTRKRIVGNKIVTETQQPDGSWKLNTGAAAKAAPATGKIKVRSKLTGQTGTLEASEYDPKLYEKL